jgi:hypothetical protein
VERRSASPSATTSAPALNRSVTEKVGRARECQLGPAQLEDATSWIVDHQRTWQRRLDRFGSYVEEQDAGR